MSQTMLKCSIWPTKEGLKWLQPLTIISSLTPSTRLWLICVAKFYGPNQSMKLATMPSYLKFWLFLATMPYQMLLETIWIPWLLCHINYTLSNIIVSTMPYHRCKSWIWICLCSLIMLWSILYHIDDSMILYIYVFSVQYHMY